jgi:hypothetical protein
MAIVGVLVIYSVVGGLMAGTQPSGAGWRLFSVRTYPWGDLVGHLAHSLTFVHLSHRNSGILF